MVNEYKRIVLLKGPECISKHNFSLFKSVLASDLSLGRDNQEKYTTAQIADIMEEKFPADAGLGKLIKFCEDLPVLKKRAEILKKERSEVIGETSLEINKQEAGPATPTSTTSHMLASERGETSTAQARTSTAKVSLWNSGGLAVQTGRGDSSSPCSGYHELTKRKGMMKEKTGVKKNKVSKEPDQPPCCEETTARCQSPIIHISSSASSTIPSAKNQKSKPQNQNIPRGAVLQSEPLTVRVLTATDPFEYGSPQHGVKNMFHATVATVSQYFHVKVFNIGLKEKFTKKNFITISNYLESKGILEISEASSVLEAAPDQMIEVPNSIIRSANVSPKICDIQKGTAGAVFYGLFMLHKKTVNQKNTIYEIKDGSGSIEVVGNGNWHNISCKEGDKLQLFCFHLKTIDKQPKLVCGEHSFIKTPRRGNAPKEPAKEEGHHQVPKQVMVLKVTEPFTYDLKEDKRMFHATVATETEFFRVKVFDTALKSKFIPRNIIAISDYFGYNGYLEIHRASCVSDVNVNQTMVVSNTLRQRANATPKISHLFSQAKGTFVNGEYLVIKKTERNKFIYYGIEDNTGKMEVVVYGRLTNVRCEPGSKLRLVCFELTSTKDGCQLRSGRHSYMQVINARR
ncbi:interferon-activable protein 204-like [Mus pahari]|uniref:interferon-activable protein 204-like n=1 Tax=Mus pahari TaxID=10093 RepID=UPI000A313B63|nr:interferon-activable protein 204-like [Mus pahari]